jgi:hypothetical protein
MATSGAIGSAACRLSFPPLSDPIPSHPIPSLYLTTATAQALHVGQVLQGSWGYDMTINEFFVIQRLTASSVWLVTLNSCCTLSPWSGRPVYHNTYD